MSYTVTANTAANPTVITCGANIPTGTAVTISGSNSTPSIDGTWTATNSSAVAFTIPVICTVAGTAGTVTLSTVVYTPKYATLAALIDYGRIALPGQTTPSIDNDILTYQLARADCAIDHHCGTDFQHLHNVLEMARSVWVDRNGWLQAQVHKPITTTTGLSVQTMNLASGERAWTTPSFAECICIADVSDGDAPRAQAWNFMALPVTYMPPTSNGSILAKVSYESGYTTIPPQLTSIAVRLAWFYYKLREAPMMKIDTLNLGTVEVPVDMPKDIRGELNTWRRPV